MPWSLEALSDRSMPGNRRFELGEWVCRAANGTTGRANSCTPIGDPGAPPADAIAAVEDWYLERALCPLFQVWDSCADDVTAVLDGRRYERGEGADVLTLDLTTVSWGPAACPVDIVEGQSGRVEGIEITDRLAELAMSSLPKMVATVRSSADGNGSTTASSGIGVLDGLALGIFAMSTEPPWQRKGLASATLSALLQAGVERGATMAWLQVMPSNEAGHRMYEQFGFSHVAAYHYRAAPLST